MKYLLIILTSITPYLAVAQPADVAPFVVELRPCYDTQPLFLDRPISEADALTLHQLRFYLGHFTFYQNRVPVFQENAYHLFDLEEAETMTLLFKFPEKITFDSLAFHLGVDSLTTASGVMGGDLDPTKGMFWTWQSGYINIKMEGIAKQCSARNGAFQFHLGGYLPPFQSVQRVGLNTGRMSGKTRVTLDLDLAPFFEQVDWAHHSSIMSPGAEAVRLSALLAKSFHVHAD